MFVSANADVIGDGLVSTGTTLLAAAEELSVDLDHFCGGQSACGTCRIKVRSGARHLSVQSSREALVLGPRAVSAGDRLACQAQVMGPVEVTVPRWF
jgi:ferredoxin